MVTVQTWLDHGEGLLWHRKVDQHRIYALQGNDRDALSQILTDINQL